MGFRLDAIKPVGGVNVGTPEPVVVPAAPARKFVTGSLGLGKFGGNTAHALARAAAVLARHSYDKEGLALLRDARVTNLAALQGNRVDFIKTISQLAGGENGSL